MRNIVVILFFLSSATISVSQVSVSQWVIGSTGSHSAAGNIMVSSTVGEGVVSTLSSPGIMLTQGFHQPSVAGGTLILDVTVEKARCLTSKDGKAQAAVLNGTPPYTYAWSPEGGNTNTATGLNPGIYFLLVLDAMGREGRDTVFIGALADDACEIHVYSGITPNNDGQNDELYIDGISIYPDNAVTLYNRWGEKVWDAKGYDNRNTVFKGNHLNGNPLPTGTYFYVLVIPGDTQTGWVQITR